jgi:hypothetical protein
MKYRVSKIDAAVHQLDESIKLFLDSKAYVSAITLAGAAEEVIGCATEGNSLHAKMKEKLKNLTGKQGKVISDEYLNPTKNWLKHWTNMTEEEVVEIDLETESIHFIFRAMGNLLVYDRSFSSETPRFLAWVFKNRLDISDDL